MGILRDQNRHFNETDPLYHVEKALDTIPINREKMVNDIRAKRHGVLKADNDHREQEDRAEQRIASQRYPEVDQGITSIILSDKLVGQKISDLEAFGDASKNQYHDNTRIARDID